MKQKERICCVCRGHKPMNGLIRIAREKTPDGFRYFIDATGNANGRGCHICRSAACVEKAVKTRALNRSYKGNVPNDIYEALKNEKI